MAIDQRYAHIYQDLFKLDGIFLSPFLMVGYQDINSGCSAFNYKDFNELLISRGVKSIASLDLFDSRASLRYDMNIPVPEVELARYAVVFDIGTLEHVFDTKQCIENCMRMVMVNGIYVLVSPVSGYFRHGLHTFNPDGLIDAINLNGFETVYLKFCSKSGIIVDVASIDGDTNIFIAARKTREMGKFIFPQQSKYSGGR